MLKLFVLVSLFSAGHGLTTQSETGISAAAHKLRALATHWATQREQNKALLSAEREMQQRLARTLNITQGDISDHEFKAVLQEVQAFAQSAKDKYVLEQKHGVNRTVQHALREAFSKLKNQNELMEEKHRHPKRGPVLVDSTFKLVSLEIVAELVSFGLAYGGGGKSKGAIMMGLYFCLEIYVWMDAGLSFQDAAYSAMQVPTTIGWGDMGLSYGGLENTRPLQIWLTMHLMFNSIICVNGFQAVIDEIIFNPIDRMVANTGNWVENNKMHCLSSFLLWIAAIGLGAITFSGYEKCTCSYGPSHVDGCVEDDCANTGGYQMNIQEALYMTVVSITSVGYGDFSPKSSIGRKIATPFFFLANVINDHMATRFYEGMSQLWGYVGPKNWIGDECVWDGKDCLNVALS